MTRRSLYFVAPGEVELREEPIPDPAADQLLVRTELSAISPGTELLVYNGEVPTELAADPNLDALSGSLSYPLKYGYAAVGVVEAVGDDVEADWLGRRVFAFHPHESHFCATVEELHPVPEGLSAAQATLLPTVETAVTLVQDGEPKLGERAVVFGQGLIGLVTTALLGQFPLQELVTVDYSADRRARSRELGATDSVHPDAIGEALPLPGEASSDEYEGADLTYELSGNPEALDAAVSVTGYDGRIVVGSWYGTKPTELDLGGRFHRSRISLTSSQVSTIDPPLRGRWDRDRRMELAWQQLGERGLGELLTDRYPIAEAPAAYDALAASTDGMVGTLFSYDGPT
ncbi:MAG: zinc-binding alcohol dehydrogenase [Euryarchaeota archaeon]|nr:zinc-binding alcohol dehydrogenase [Euryarchaeota archaeon]